MSSTARGLQPWLAATRFWFVGLPFSFASLPFSFASLPFSFASLPFSFASLPVRLTFRSRPLVFALSVVAVLALSVVAGACSGARSQQVDGEVLALRDEVDELKRSQAAARVQFDELKSRLVMIEERADSARVDRARRDSGWIPKLPTVKVEAPAEAHDVEMAEPSPPPTPSGPSSDLPPQTDADKPKADQAVALYTQAKALLDVEQVTAARGLFDKLLTAHPDHDLADNALYWIGESWYAQSQWLKAAHSFVRVAKEYPRGNKVPDAMYKLAKSYEKMGDDPGAGEVLKQLARQYPGTPSAKRALDDLQRKNAKGEL